LDTNRVDYKLLSHAICRTSAESARARALAGFPNTVGAKALLLRAEFVESAEYCLAVLPGNVRLDSRALNKCLASLKRFRFATVEEMFEICGVTPGAMPPFGNSVFPQIRRLFIDESLNDAEIVGFNAADLESSIVMRGGDYVRVAQPTAIFRFCREASS
jgi:prolyl-tRNA editing enzyme YbaK/EbsC (Cys-tRNA(Pro) deacylase)